MLTNITVNDVDSPPPASPSCRTPSDTTSTAAASLPVVRDGFFNGENHVGHKATGQCAAISVPL